MIITVPSVYMMREKHHLTMTPEEILGLALLGQIASHLQPLTHQAPKSHRLRMEVKPVTRKGGSRNWADRTTDVHRKHSL